MLDDPMLTARATELIRGQRRNAEWAVQQAGDELGAMFNQADDPYLRERKGDLQDVDRPPAHEPHRRVERRRRIVRPPASR